MGAGDAYGAGDVCGVAVLLVGKSSVGAWGGGGMLRAAGDMLRRIGRDICGSYDVGAVTSCGVGAASAWGRGALLDATGSGAGLAADWVGVGCGACAMLLDDGVFGLWVGVFTLRGRSNT